LSAELLHVALIKLPVLCILRPKQLLAACLERALRVATFARQDFLGLCPVIRGVTRHIITLNTVGVGIKRVHSSSVDPKIRGVDCDG
jgi:hypothetical protein